MQILGHWPKLPDQRMKPKANGTSKRVDLGEHIVADPLICRERWGGRIPLAAVAEAVKLARRALLDKHGRLLPAA